MDNSVSNGVLVSRLRVFTNAVSIFSVSVGSLVLAGWLFGVPSLKTVTPGLASMKANTALCLVLCGLSLWITSRNEIRNSDHKFVLRLGECLALAVFLLGVATLAEYLFHWNLRIDQLLFMDLAPDGHSPPGRMAPHTAFCFLVLGSAMVLSRVETKRGSRPAQFLSFIPALISLMAIVGYLYSVVSFYRISSYTGMALHTAVTLFLLSFAVFFSRPDRGLAAIVSSDSLGGIVLRRLVPAAFIVPIVIGWFRMEGQKAGFYGTESGLALMVTVNIVVFSFVVYLCGAEISKIAAARQESERALQVSRDGLLALNYTFESVIDACPLPIVTLDQESRIQVWNRAAERLLGWSSIQVRGRPISLAPEERRREFQTIVEMLQQGDAVTGIETVLLSRDDTKVTVTLWAAPIGVGGSSGCVLVLENSAQRKQPEFGLHHAHPAT
jgi:PAS domain S-box-containing protein